MNELMIKYKDIFKKIDTVVKNEINRLLNRAVELGYIEKINSDTVQLQLNSDNNVWITINSFRRKIKITILEDENKTYAKSFSGFYGK